VRKSTMFKHSTGFHSFQPAKQQGRGLAGNCGMRYGMGSLYDEAYNPTKYQLHKPTDPQLRQQAIAVVQAFINPTKGWMGMPGNYTDTLGYWGDTPSQSDKSLPVVVRNQIGAGTPSLWIVTSKPSAITDQYGLIVGPAEIPQWRNTPYIKANPVEFLYVIKLLPKPKDNTGGGGTKKKDDTTGEDCPPPENCVEKWVDKTLHVSARPSPGAIEIPVAFKKIICEGDMEEDPQMDCDELLKALKGSIEEGGVPGMMGLSQVPQDPNWCDDCEERLVKASAYVTEEPAPGSKPFKVKVKVLVCETDADPDVDCEEVLRALGAGLRAKRKAKTLKGLSESSRVIGTNVTPQQPTMPNAPTTAQNSGGEFDTEANKLDPTRAKAQQAGFPWWMWLVLGGTAAYVYRAGTNRRM
jgi:hypothetical protein